MKMMFTLQRKLKAWMGISIFSCISFGIFAQSLSSPVSAVFDKTNNRYLIANPGSNSILSMDANRNLTTFMDTSIFSIGRMTLVGDTLYFIDGGKVKGLNLINMSYTLDVIVGTALSDIVADNNGNLYLGDYNVDLIYKVIIATGTVSEYMKDAVSGVTGLAYDKKKNRLIISSFKPDSPIEAVNLSTATFSTLLSTDLPWMNSIEIDKNGHIFFALQDSQGVYYYNADFSEGPLKLAGDLSGVEDIYYNEDHDSLVIVNSGDHTVKIVAVPQVTSIAENILDYKWSIYPNPSTSCINLNLRLSENSDVSVEINDLNGKVVLSVPVKHYLSGNHELRINSQNLASGLYLVKLRVNESATFQKLILN